MSHSTPLKPGAVIREKQAGTWFWSLNALYKSFSLNDSTTTYAAILKPSAVVLYEFLCCRADNRTQTCHPGTNTIEARTGLAEATIAKAKRTLIEHRLIAIVDRTAYTGGLDTQLIVLLDPIYWRPVPCSKQQLKELDPQIEAFLDLLGTRFGKRENMRIYHPKPSENEPGGSEIDPPLPQDLGQVPQDVKGHIRQQDSLQDLENKTHHQAALPRTDFDNADDVSLKKKEEASPPCTPEENNQSAPTVEHELVEEQSQEAVAALIEAGVSADRAVNLALKIPTHEILQRVQWLPWYQKDQKQPIRNVGAWLAGAIEGRYAKPASLEEYEQRQAEIEQAKQRKAERIGNLKEEEQTRNENDSEKTAKRERLNAQWEALPSESQDALDAEILKDPAYSNLKTQGVGEVALMARRRVLLDLGWSDAAQAPLDSHARTQRDPNTITTAELMDFWKTLTQKERQHIDKCVHDNFKGIKVDIEPDTPGWFTQRNHVMRKMIRQGQLNFSLEDNQDPDSDTGRDTQAA